MFTKKLYFFSETTNSFFNGEMTNSLTIDIEIFPGDN